LVGRTAQQTWSGLAKLFGKKPLPDEAALMRRPVVSQFLSYKVAPQWSLWSDIRSGKHVGGEDITPMSMVREHGGPMIFNDVYDAMKEQGILGGTALSILVLHGPRLQTYPPNKPKSKSKGLKISGVGKL
jgi:hypothetical protein